MHEQRATLDPLPASEIRVEQYRQILVWPLQLPPALAGRRTSTHWETLERDSHWEEVADEFTNDGDDFQERHYAEFLAFMPDVQRFLYGEVATEAGEEPHAISPIHLFRRRDIARARIVLSSGDRPIDFDVARVELYFFYDVDVAIVAVELAANGLSLAKAQDALFRIGRAYPKRWNADGSATECCASIHLLDVDGKLLAASDYEIRQRHLHFVCAQRAPPLAAHWAYLIEPLALSQTAGPGAIPVQQLEQQRIASLAYLAVDDPFRIAREDWMRLALGSGPGPLGSTPIAAGHLGDFEQRYCYDRFWDGKLAHDQTAMRLLCSDHACVTVGEAHCGDFVDREIGMLGQFRHQLFIIGLIAHFHRAALLVHRDRLVTAISGLSDYAPDTVRRFKRDIRLTHENFLRFTHRYWFQQISSVRPIQDLFALWSRHLGTAGLFAEVREEVQDMVEYLDSDGLRRQASMVVRLTVVTFFGLIGTIVTGFLGMNIFDLAEVSPTAKTAILGAVALPITVLIFFIAAKSQVLAEFLDAVSNPRHSTRQKLAAFAKLWRGGSTAKRH